GSKGLLVEACRDLLPPSVYQRPKSGFVLPMTGWMRGPLAPFVDEGVRETIARELLPEDFVNGISRAFCEDRLHWTRLWNIVVLGHFAKCAADAVHKRSEEHTSELQSHLNLVCRLLLEKKKEKKVS